MLKKALSTVKRENEQRRSDSSLCHSISSEEFKEEFVWQGMKLEENPWVEPGFTFPVPVHRLPSITQLAQAVVKLAVIEPQVDLSTPVKPALVPPPLL